MNLIDGPLIEGHVSVMTAFKRDQVPSLDDVWLAEVLELDILILKVKVAELALTATILLAAR